MRASVAGWGVVLVLVGGLTASAQTAHEVTASALNVRASAGGRLLGTVHRGARFVVSTSRSGWSQIDWQVHRGWVATRYLTRVSATGVKVTPDALNVRSGPGTSASRIGIVRRNQIYVRLETRSGWERIQFDDRTAWVAGWLTEDISINRTLRSTTPASTASRRTSATASELEILARICKGEAGVTSYEGKVAVCAVVLNRVRSSRFPDTIRGVAHQPFQFSCYNSNVRDRLYWGPSPQACWDAARDALSGRDPSLGATYYFNPYLVLPSWSRNMTFLVRIGNRRSNTHDFYRP